MIGRLLVLWVAALASWVLIGLPARALLDIDGASVIEGQTAVAGVKIIRAAALFGEGAAVIEGVGADTGIAKAE